MHRSKVKFLSLADENLRLVRLWRARAKFRQQVIVLRIMENMSRKYNTLNNDSKIAADGQRSNLVRFAHYWNDGIMEYWNIGFR